MKILISGGTGFIGTHLCNHFLKQNDEVTVLTRNLNRKFIDKVKLVSELDTSQQYDCIINLAGEKLNNKRWSEKFKKIIYDSRIETTKKIISFIENTPIKPKLFLSGSAIGYYGTHKNRIFTEKTISNDSSFSSKLCQVWEQVASKAQEFGVRTIFLRTSIVLGKDGGIIKELFPLFNLNLGSIIGDGNQFMSWIHIDDYISAVQYIIDEPSYIGPINLTSPNVTTNKEFTQTFAKTLNKRQFLVLPKPLIKLIFGQMGKELLLDGQKVYPSKLMDSNFNFKFSNIHNALNDLLNKDKPKN